MAEAEKYVFKVSCDGFILHWEYYMTCTPTKKKVSCIVYFSLKTDEMSFKKFFYKVMWYLIYKISPTTVKCTKS